MSQDDTTRTPEPNDPAEPAVTMEQPASEPVISQGETTSPGGAANDPTIGTGTSIALGCIAGTVLLIGIGLIYLLIAAIF